MSGSRGGSISPTTGSRNFPEASTRAARQLTVTYREAGHVGIGDPQSRHGDSCDRSPPLERDHGWRRAAEDGRIVEIGTYQELSRKHPNVAVVGSGKEVMLPGFVNGHHHIGLTPVQLGSPDMPLELWFVTRLVMRNVNLYLDTLYSAFEMIASGVTTVQHLHGRLPGKLDQVERGCDEAIRAYRDVGMRVSYSYAVRDQNRLVYQRDEDFMWQPLRKAESSRGVTILALALRVFALHSLAQRHRSSHVLYSRIGKP
jgi:cytosine/adenosine deaminase-related metal-dependent hydrolase